LRARQDGNAWAIIVIPCSAVFPIPWAVLVMRSSSLPVIRRILPRLWPVVFLAGCGAPERPREVPITRSAPATPDDEARAPTKAPRAIATH
jgi:hypothetical protein